MDKSDNPELLDVFYEILHLNRNNIPKSSFDSKIIISLLSNLPKENKILSKNRNELRPPAELMRRAVGNFGNTVIEDLARKVGKHAGEPLAESIRTSIVTLGDAVATLIGGAENLLSTYNTFSQSFRVNPVFAKDVKLLEDSFAELKRDIAVLSSFYSSATFLLEQHIDKTVSLPQTISNVIERVQFILPLLDSKLEEVQQKFVHFQITHYASSLGMTLDELIDKRARFHEDKNPNATETEKAFNRDMLDVLTHYARKRTLQREVELKRQREKLFVKDQEYAQRQAARRVEARKYPPSAIVRFQRVA